MIEIRIHGRGGQGSVTAAELIAVAAFYDGKYSQAFPNFGVERRGAPIEAYMRIDSQPIKLRSQIYEPDFIIIQDDTLLDAINPFKGCKKETKVIINSEREADLKLPIKKNNILFIPATKIALEILGKPIINTVMLGAFARFSGLVKIESIVKAIKGRFSGKILEKNIKAVEAAYNLK
ncbi:pyruvate ferredoxin oxidoreductase subunit gamma [Candidatus Parcubacteria bacterium]|nr:pyruvate ferredoxin oxidoreductase subunit gamma [Candidatus Parcubacteria bacterium]